MKGRTTGQDTRVVREHDDVSINDVIHAGHVVMKKRGEIAVFDAGKYFAGAGNRRLQINQEVEEELDEDADVEAGGDLPLSPLPEFYSTRKAKHYTRKDQWQQGDKDHVYAEAHVRNLPATKTTGGAIPSPAQRRTVTSIDPLRMPNGDSLPSSPSVASAGHDRVQNEPRGPPTSVANSTNDPLSHSRSSTIKSQPFSPSSRLASFLAKFKLSSSESKSKPSSQYSSATPPTSAAPMPKGSSSNAAPLPANGKAPSPRGRFLRVLSSSSSHSNPLVKPVTHMHYHSSITASTPVSPAGSDPYSPITHSASTTPTSRKNPRSRPRSHVSTHHEGTSPGFRPSLPTTDWRRGDLDNSSSRSLSTHLPFLRRKLKAYLMPEKSPRHHHDNHQQLMNKQEKKNTHHVGNGVHAEDRQPHTANKASTTYVSDKPRAASHLLEACVDDRQQWAYKGSTAETKDKPQAAEHSSAPRLDQRHHKPNHNMMRSPGRRMMEPAMTKDTRIRRGDWRRQQAELEMEDDIEVAERLLRVVKEHQSSKTYTSSYKGTSNYRQQSNGYANYQANGGEVSGGSSSRKGRKSLVSPSSSPAANYHSKQASKEECACPYDSDSSSDLFEIESTLQAFSHVAGLYRARDLPVYDSNPLKSPLHLK